MTKIRAAITTSHRSEDIADNSTIIPIKRLDHGAGIAVPTKATDGSAAFDLAAAINQPITLRPGQRHLVPSGFAIAVAPGYEGQIRPRSGLALKHGITVLNAPGTIDSDYRGEIGVILINHGHDDWTIERGQRIAQLVISQLAASRLVEVQNLPLAGGARKRHGGFGSTGSHALAQDTDT